MEHLRDNIIQFPGTRARESAAPMFLDLAQEWIRVEALRLVEPENERRHINHLKALWRLTEAELRPRSVKEALANLLKPNGPLSASTVNKVRGTGRRIIREAMVNERWTGPNPFEVIGRLRETKPDHRTLSLEECRRVLPHLRADRRREALLMLYLGLRPGEMKALQKQDVDLTAGRLTVRRSNARDSTKTGKVRTVPIPDGLRPSLEEAMNESPETCPLIFPAEGGKRQRADAKLTRMLGVALTKAGLVTGYELICRRKGCGERRPSRTADQTKCSKCNFTLWAEGTPIQVRFYDLRHSAATLHREAGADPLAIQLALGHAPENLTDGIYTHLSAEYLRRELNKLKL